MRDELDVVMQVVRRDGQVAPAPPQLGAAVAGQDEVQAQLLDRTAVELEAVYLQKYTI